MGNKRKSISYAKWGYLFILPFFLVYCVCTLVPLFSTFYYSFFEYYRVGVSDKVGPTFVGFDNYIELFKFGPNGALPEVFNNTANTLIMWVMGAVPQILFALILALIFTGIRLRIKGQGFFKTVIYMPNLIMASAFSMLFFALFDPVGPINQIMQSFGGEKFYFFQDGLSVRIIVAFINFLMWFGNTTILLMAGIMGIDQSLFEAASIDGASSRQTFFKVTLPLLMPIIVYVLITAMIGGLQMFDVPQIIDSKGGPLKCAKTLIMQLNGKFDRSDNYGAGGALATYIFAITAIISLAVYKITGSGSSKKKAKGGK